MTNTHAVTFISAMKYLIIKVDNRKNKPDGEFEHSPSFGRVKACT